MLTKKGDVLADVELGRNLLGDPVFAHWERHGFAVCKGFMPPTELQVAWRQLVRIFPSWTEYASNPVAHNNYPAGGCYRAFPYLGSLNNIAFHSDIVAFAKRALRSSSIILTQSLIWAKYGGLDVYDQPLHADYMNQSILYPCNNVRESVQFII